MAGNLKSRLARIRESRPGPGALQPRPGLPEASRRNPPSFLRDWEAAAEFVWTRSLRFDNPLPRSLDPAAFASLGRSLRRPVESPPAPRLPSPRVDCDALRFFDLETTGLSGGAGTIAFLSSIGRIDEPGYFYITQVFLEDFPGEAAFISLILGLLCDEGSTVVSYNGKAFDLPLLRSRCVMTGNQPPYPAHIDALFASRRLWSRVHGAASLGLLEREVLGIERGEDIPGAMIPEVWLSFAKSGESELMPLVLRHNADDVLGLARLVARLQSVFDGPRAYEGRSDLDRAGLGRSLLAIGREEEGEALLASAADGGDEGAGLILLRRYRLSGRIDKALDIARRLPANYRIAVEKAKLYERHRLDLDEAARCAKEALELAGNEVSRELAARRMERIDRKRSGASPRRA